MAISKTSTEGELLKEYWNETLLQELRANLVFRDIAVEGIMPSNEGVTVHWLSIADISAGVTISEGTDPTESSLSAGDQTASLIQKGDFVKLTDVLLRTWIGSALDGVVERMARNARETIDLHIRDAIFTAGGLVQYAGTAVARNSIATDAYFDFDIAEARKAVATLENANVPGVPMYSGMYCGIVHPHVAHDLMGDSNWVDIVKYVDKYDDRLMKNVIGEAYGIVYKKTTHALKMVASGSASTDVYQTYIVGDEYLGMSKLYDAQMIVQNPLPGSPLKLVSTIGWKAMYAIKELKVSAMIRVESGSSLGT